MRLEGSLHFFCWKKRKNVVKSVSKKDKLLTSVSPEENHQMVKVLKHMAWEKRLGFVEGK